MQKKIALSFDGGPVLGCTDKILCVLEKQQVPASELVVIGDGPVEIQIGRQMGARTLGLASDEKNRKGFDQRKNERLARAGAERIIGDFLPASMKGIPEWLGLD